MVRGRGSEGRGRGWEGSGWEWRGRKAGWAGTLLLNFHLIFQKTWAEPGNPSKYYLHL